MECQQHLLVVQLVHLMAPLKASQILTRHFLMINSSPSHTRYTHRQFHLTRTGPPPGSYSLPHGDPLIKVTLIEDSPWARKRFPERDCGSFTTMGGAVLAIGFGIENPSILPLPKKEGRP
jgi:hypothetical protein